MKNWIRIFLICFALVGGTAFFSYWSINRFNQAFDHLSAPYLANTRSIYLSFKQNTGLASTSPEISEELATSTDETIPVITSTTTTATGSASSPQATTPATVTSTDLELSFTFPPKGTGVYIGCTYPISWQSSTMINSLVTTLVDAGTRETMGPIASGLAKENTIERDLQNLNWKVGNVWPGAYYIKISKINDVEAELRSKVFEINKMSKNISTSEKENVCKESGGSF